MGEGVTFCHRLEYGKFVDDDGIVEGKEHGVLAVSSEFPENVKFYCGPRVICMEPNLSYIGSLGLYLASIR